MRIQPRLNQKHRVAANTGGLWRLCYEAGAQSLVEVALMLPVFILLLAYSVEYGYCFIAVASIASSARNAVEYAIQGPVSITGVTTPTLGSITTPKSVAGTAYGNMSGFVNASTSVAVQLCTSNNGTITCTSSPSNSALIQSSFQPDADPLPTLFQLARVDVVYTITPPVPVTFFQTTLFPSLHFHRMAEMRILQ